MAYNYIFPTCLFYDNQVNMAEELLPVAEEYLNKYGEQFQTNPNHVSTYRNKIANLVIKPDPRFNNIREYLKTQAKEYIKKQNINLDPLEPKLNEILFLINRITKTGNHPTHSHPNSILSGCFYLKCNDNDPPIIFSDPRNYFKYSFYEQRIYDQNNINTLSPDYAISVKPGLLLLWPSWLDHGVPPSDNNNDERISIAFNIGIT